MKNNKITLKYLLLMCAVILPVTAFAEEAAESQTSEKKSVTDKAREALAKTEGEDDQAKQLEEVFDSVDDSYSLIAEGGVNLVYGLNYSYFGDQSIRIEMDNGSLRALDVNPTGTHTVTNSFSFSTGVMDNLTLGVRLPLVYKYQTSSKLDATSVGDVSVNLSWQPFPYKPGAMSTTLFASLSLPTGDSPYDIDSSKRLSTGSGTYALGAGVSVSKVLDPIVLFGSASVSVPFATDNNLNQISGGSILQQVTPGNSVSFSGGFAYSLSYDVSLSASYSQSISAPTTYTYISGAEFETAYSSSSNMNLSLGIRSPSNDMINISAGFGLSEDAADATLGVSFPIDIANIKDD